MNLDRHEYEAELNEYLDGELERERVVELEAELERSAELRDLLAELRKVRELVRALPLTMPPKRDLWPEIAGQLDDDDKPGWLGRLLGLQGAWGWRGAAALAGAAVVTLFVVMDRPDPIDEAPTPAADTSEAIAKGEEPEPPEPEPAARTVLPVEGEYLAAVATLAEVYQIRRASLEPATAQTIDESLTLIDAAIASSRDALETEPDSAELQSMLEHAYEHKIDLLRDATEVGEWI